VFGALVLLRPGESLGTTGPVAAAATPSVPRSSRPARASDPAHHQVPHQTPTAAPDTPEPTAPAGASDGRPREGSRPDTPRRDNGGNGEARDSQPPGEEPLLEPEDSDFGESVLDDPDAQDEPAADDPGGQGEPIPDSPDAPSAPPPPAPRYHVRVQVDAPHNPGPAPCNTSGGFACLPPPHNWWGVEAYVGSALVSQCRGEGGFSCQFGSFADGTVVTLKAVGSSVGSLSWTGCDHINPCILTVHAASTTSVRFGPPNIR